MEFSCGHHLPFARPVKFMKHIAAFNVIVISLLAEETEVEPCHMEAVSPGLLIIGPELFALEGASPGRR